MSSFRFPSFSPRSPQWGGVCTCTSVSIFTCVCVYTYRETYTHTHTYMCIIPVYVPCIRAWTKPLKSHHTSVLVSVKKPPLPRSKREDFPPEQIKGRTAWVCFIRRSRCLTQVEFSPAHVMDASRCFWNFLRFHSLFNHSGFKPHKTSHGAVGWVHWLSSKI